MGKECFITKIGVLEVDEKPQKTNKKRAVKKSGRKGDCEKTPVMIEEVVTDNNTEKLKKKEKVEDA
jgi:hypothetical protein